MQSVPEMHPPGAAHGESSFSPPRGEKVPKADEGCEANEKVPKSMMRVRTSSQRNLQSGEGVEYNPHSFRMRP